MFNKLLLIAIASLTIGCGDTNITNQIPTTPTPTTPTGNTIEFRVTGNANSARIRYSNSDDGIAQTVSALPFFYSFNTTDAEMFLSIEVTPVQNGQLILDPNPFLAAQIFVNNKLFREGSSVDYTTTLEVSGNWRR